MNEEIREGIDSLTRSARTNGFAQGLCVAVKILGEIRDSLPPAQFIDDVLERALRKIEEAGEVGPK